jgi:hypothetical protein
MGLGHLSFEPMQLENAQRNRVLPGVLPWIILSAFTVLWIVFFPLTSPQPGGTDVFVFRDAGCNWAAGRGLVAASVPHANTVMPMLFASYTPGDLILFGLAASSLIQPSRSGPPRLLACSAPRSSPLSMPSAGPAALVACWSVAPSSSSW